jgi:hypothetical protein
MNIIEALGGATDAGHVHALLEAYLDAVQCHDYGLTVPPAVTRLPIQGEDDISRRYADALILNIRCIGETGRHDPLVAEVADVCHAALRRLESLAAQLEQAA